MVKKSSSIGILLLLLSVAASAVQHQKTEELLSLLAAIIPDGPGLVTPEIVALMEQAGATKRLDAANLLIRGLALNWSPVGSNESKSLMEMFPAAPMLIRHYGPMVLPLLIYAGVTTDQEWLQKRIVLVIRGLGKEGEVEEAREAFSMKTTTNPAARRFKDLMDTSDLKIELVDPSREAGEDLDRRIGGVKPPR